MDSQLEKLRESYNRKEFNNKYIYQDARPELPFLYLLQNDRYT